MTPDPYQAYEAAAFSLMPQANQPTTAGAQGDLFGIPADQAADLASRCASHHRQRPASTPDLFA